MKEEKKQQRDTQTQEPVQPDAAEEAKKARRKSLYTMLLLCALLVGGFFLHSFLNEQQQKAQNQGFRNADFAPDVAEDNALLRQFQADFANCKKVLRACEEDVTDDGRKDLIVIYRTDEGDTRTVVCQNNEEGIRYSEPIPGPIENQQIQFKNIDKEGEIEFIISGEKKGAVGYAIYRMIDGEPIDLFGDGMAECC